MARVGRGVIGGGYFVRLEEPSFSAFTALAEGPSSAISGPDFAAFGRGVGDFARIVVVVPTSSTAGEWALEAYAICADLE